MFTFFNGNHLVPLNFVLRCLGVFCVAQAEMKSKMYEARLEDEKMKLNQKHDRKVEEILSRKNGEIEELKNHYRTKTREQEETLQKYERKCK